MYAMMGGRVGLVRLVELGVGLAIVLIVVVGIEVSVLTVLALTLAETGDEARNE
jgi:hypothetical protein